LAVARSLGRKGVPVDIVDEHPRGIAAVSRYCRAFSRVPSPSRTGEAFVGAVRREVERGKHRVVIPTDDVTLALISRARSQFDGLAVLPFPDADTIQTAHDKGALMSLAEEKGVPVPNSVVVRNPGDLGLAVRQIGFPAVVKARVSRFLVGGEWRSATGTYYANTEAELEAACRAAGEIVPHPLVQEYVPGDGRGIFVLMNHGRLRAAFAHRRIREKPPSGGVSVLSESVALDPQLLEHAERILEALKWHGVAMVEFRRDARDGVARLLEINGRFWGSLQLAIDAGVDFPYLLYRLAVEGDVEPVLTYDVGVRLRWWLGDLDWLLLRLRDRSHAGDGLVAIREFLGSTGKTTRAEVFRRDDPGPGAVELAQYVGQATRSALSRLGRRIGGKRCGTMVTG
jgi:predicted ATP-grasp superfamily ATP-dependent carboligase